MPDELKKTQLRTIQYFYTDGSFEIGFALLCFVLAIFFHLENLLQGTWFAALVESMLVFVVIGGAFLTRRFVRKWKERITFPRTGVVTYPRKDGQKRGWILMFGLVFSGALAAAAMYTFLLNEVSQISLMPLLTGVIFSCVLFFVGWRTSLPRFYIQATIGFLAGFGLAFSPFGNYIGLAAFYLIIGLGLFTSGILILRNYQRQNPLPPAEETDDQ
jgi:hypothetical protein